jgi:hypothetical protein
VITSRDAAEHFIKPAPFDPDFFNHYSTIANASTHCTNY